MTWRKVEWYSLAFKCSDRQAVFHYGLQGDDSAHRIAVSVAELAALGDMFRNESPINHNSEDDSFMTDREKVGRGEPSMPHPMYP